MSDKGSKTRKALAASKNKRAERLRRIEKALARVAVGQARNAARLQSLGTAYNNLLNRLVEKGVLTEEELAGPENVEVVRESIEDEKP